MFGILLQNENRLFYTTNTMLIILWPTASKIIFVRTTNFVSKRAIKTIHGR